MTSHEPPLTPDQHHHVRAVRGESAPFHFEYAWRLPVHRAAAGHGTEARIVWCVTSRRRSVRLFRGLAPWAHGRVMRAGERGLAQRFGREN